MAPPVEKYLARFDGASQTIEDCIESLLPEKAALPLKKVAIISTATRAFVELKSASRTACLAIRDARQSLEAREAALDERHLELQNLLYRRHRLLDEVASCRDYKCDGIAQIKRDDADVSADFLSQFATPAMACDVSDSVHESRLATLALELEARTSSSKQLAGTVERKKALDADLSRKSAALQTLPALLAAVKKAAKPLRDVQLEAGPKSKRLKADSGDDVLEAEPDLPRPLYVLYAQLIAARASVFGNDATVEIVGGAEFSAGGLTRLAKSVALSVSSARGNTRVAFYHVAPLDVVCVECWRAGVKDAAFLAGLFPDSHTQLSAAASHAVLQHNLDAAVATGAGGTWPIEAFGAPFDWAQWLCGLSTAPLSSNGRLEPSVRCVCGALRGRIAARDMLEQQIEALSRRPPPNPIPVHAGAEVCFAPSRGAALTSMTADKGPANASMTSLFFAAVLQRSGKSLKATIEVFADYPARPPVFSLQPGGAFHAGLSDIEAEVNAYADELVDEHSAAMVLSHQLRKLATCFDALSEKIDAADASAFGRARRGRDRRVALVYDARAKAAVHRLA